MSEIISQQRVLWDGYDLSKSVFSFMISNQVEVNDDTTLGDEKRSNVPALRVPGIQVEGYYKTTDYDKALNATIARENVLISVLTSISSGTLAWFMNAVHASYEPVKGEVGKNASFSAGGMSHKSPLVRGVLLGYSESLTGLGYSPSSQLGAVATGQKLYAGLHVFGINNSGGDTLNVTIESDDNSGFTSKADRIVFDQMTNIGSQYKTLDGPVTDIYFRSKNTPAGTTPSFKAAILLGIM